MKHERFEKLLDDYAEYPLPRCPDGVAAGVWREVELRRSLPSWKRLFLVLDWRELLSEPRFAVAGLACAFAIGLVPAAFAAREQAQQRLARQSFFFEVFSPESTQPFAVSGTNPAASAPGDRP
jgi:hypothetical protein